MRYLFFCVVSLFLFNSRLLGQCDCTDCPIFLDSNTTETSEIEVVGLVNETLGVNGQGVCGISINFNTDAADELTFSVTAPDGSMIDLFVETGLSSGQNITFDILFLPCSETPMPDPGFSPQFDSSEPWVPNSFYTGSYHPSVDCLEDFTGPANGTWTLTMTDFVGLDDSNLFDWELIFCDGTGTDCGEEPTCEADAGTIDINPSEFCEGDPALDFNLSPSYVGDAPNPLQYGYQYVISDTDGNVIEFTDDPNLTTFAPGNYSICGMSYLLTDQPLINVLPNTVSDIETNIANMVYCAAIFCVDLNIAEDFPDVIMDWDGIDELCANQDYTFSVVNFDPLNIYSILINSGAFNSVSEVNGSITINPAVGSPTVEICISIVGDCTPNEVCKQFEVIGDDDPILLDFPPEVCIENSFDVFILNNPLADNYSWEISGPGVFVSQDLASAQISPTGVGTITICITPSSIECGDGMEECFDVEVIDPPLPEIITDLTVCLPGGNLTADVFSPSSTVEWVVLSGIGSFQIVNTTAISTDYTVDLPGIYEIQLTENTGECVRVNVAFIEVLEPTEILIDNLCNNGEYTTTITFVNGTAPYFIDGNQIVGNTFEFGPNASGSSFTFSYSDVNLCTEVESVTESCPCVSEAGTMDETPINVCGDQDIMGIYNNDGFLDNNDGAQFILTTSSVNPTTTIVQISNDGTFSFQPPLSFNTTYYIFHIVGDANGSSVDLTDPCLSVSNFQSVVWHEPPQITMQEDFSTCDFTATAGVISSIPVNSEWSLIDSPPGGDAIIANPSGLTTDISFTFPGVYTFEYIATTDFCTVVEQLEIEIFPPISVVNVTEECDGLNYTVSFEISAGAPPFNINGIVIFSNFYQSEPIPSGNIYDFIITDNNGCIFTDVFGQKNCDCDSDAGTMVLDIIEVCPTTVPIQAIFNNDAIFEPDDVGEYVLHEGSGVEIINSIATNNSGSFEFEPSVMNEGQTYYISYVVGNDNGSGSVDLNDPCLDITPGQPVVWNAPPLSLLDTDYFTCSDSLVISNSEISTEFSSINWMLLNGPADGELSVLTLGNEESIIIVNRPGNYEIEVEIVRADCSTKDTITLLNNKINLIGIAYTCDSLTGNYSATIQWEGGNAPFYIGEDTIETRVYEIHNLESGISFQIDMQDTLSCTLENVTGSTICDCFPPIHSMNLDTLSSCDTSATFSFFPTDIGELSDEDKAALILHTNSTDSLGTIIQISTDGSIQFMNMELDIVYFLSFVSGDSLANGTIDLTDPCLSVSFGKPIVFHSTPFIDAGENQEICGTMAQLSATSDAETLLWQILEFPTSSFQIINDPNSTNPVITVDLPGEYILMVTGERNGCIATDTTILTFYEPLSISSVDRICSEDNSSYTVEFQISGGAPPYLVDGVQLIGTSYQSNPIPNLIAYNFNVEDSGPCESVEVEGSFDCSCTSLPGDLVPGLYELCEGENLDLQFLVDPIIDAGFSSGFILHDGSLQTIENILIITNQTTVQYDPAYPLNQTLIVTPFVGEGDISTIDFTDPCTLFGNGIEVIWQSLTRIEFDAPPLLCEGDTLLFQLTLDAPSYPQEVEIAGSNFMFSGSIQDGSTFSVLIPVEFGGDYVITLNENLCLESGTNLSFTVTTENCDCTIYTFEPEFNFCTSDSIVNLDAWLVEEGMGTWSIISSESDVPPFMENNRLIIQDATSGTTDLAYVSNEPDACDSTYFFTIFLEEEIKLSILETSLQLCQGTQSDIDLFELLSNQNYPGQWTTMPELPDNLFMDGIVSTEDFEPGDYFFEYVLDNEPLVCLLEPLIVELTILKPVDFIITSTNPACFGETGSLLIEVLNGPPEVTTITLNSEIIEDPDISNLDPGEYQIVLTDENLCTYLESALIEEPDELQLELEGMVETNSDGNLAIISALSNINFENANITWFSNGSEIISANDSVLLLNIFGETEISILLEDENGCSVEDLIILALEEQEVDISFPNVMRFGGNGENAMFQIPPYPGIKMIEELSVFDRWGEQLFLAEDYDPATQTIFWDGTFNGSAVSLGVYVFKLVYLDRDDNRKIEYGDIAVIAN
ncbi:MAG: gliding motility-associated C-terminal domain-containing protein [Bacteroidota bacterium]